MANATSEGEGRKLLGQLSALVKGHTAEVEAERAAKALEKQAKADAAAQEMKNAQESLLKNLDKFM